MVAGHVLRAEDKATTGGRAPFRRAKGCAACATTAGTTSAIALATREDLRGDDGVWHCPVRGRSGGARPCRFGLGICVNGRDKRRDSRSSWRPGRSSLSPTRRTACHGPGTNTKAGRGCTGRGSATTARSHSGRWRTAAAALYWHWLGTSYSAAVEPTSLRAEYDDAEGVSTGGSWRRAPRVSVVHVDRVWRW